VVELRMAEDALTTLKAKTVETHLAHVSTKLDVSARAAVARALRT
jgi:DNA-binding NarL/FixJ family response regulator